MSALTPPLVSIYIITLNEQAHLEEVLQSTIGADEIVIVDSGSTDDTLSIAEKYKARVIHQSWLGFAKQKSFAMQQCTHEWVICLDGDEVLPEGAIAAIKQAIVDHPGKAFSFPRHDYFMGGPMEKAKRKFFLKVYPKSKTRWRETDLVHEHVDVALPVMRLPLTIKHYGHDSAEIIIAKKNRYSTLKATQRIGQGRSFSVARMLLIYPLMFLKLYFLHRFCFCGWRGLIKANVEASYFFWTEAKLYEHQFKSSRDSSRDH